MRIHRTWDLGAAPFLYKIFIYKIQLNFIFSRLDEQIHEYT
jgi:hypothetical protein